MNSFEQDRLLHAIDLRRSRRKYVSAPLPEEDVSLFRKLMDTINYEHQLNMELVVGNGRAFAGFLKTYGFFTGVQNYFALVGAADDFAEQEKYGYFGEQVMLEAVLSGYGTCWVGGTFDKNATPVKLEPGQTIPCVITIGKVKPDLSAREKAVYRLTHRRGTKTIEVMSEVDGDMPAWFVSGMQAVQKAPSAVNRQPVVFSYKDGVVTSSVADPSVDRIGYDLGIAKLHFEIGSGGGTWEWGNGGAFVKSGRSAALKAQSSNENLASEGKRQ